MKKFLHLLILFQLSSLSFFAQQIEIGNIYDYKFSLLDSTKNELYVYGADFYKTINLSSLKIDSAALTVSEDFNFKEYFPLINNSKHYFIHNSGGLVYLKRNDSIIRIDNSFKHLMQSNSTIFSYNDTIHCFGGYGFWSGRNFITFYDEVINEWEIINLKKSKKLPKGFINGVHFISNDELYVFNSYYINPFNRYENIHNENVWKYSFTEKKWELLGKLHNSYFNGEQIRLEIAAHPFDIKPIRFQNKLLFFLISEIAIIDFNNNRITRYEKGTKAHYLNGALDSHYFNDRFYYFTNDDFDTMYLAIATPDEMIGPKKSHTKFYTNNALLVQVLIGLVIIIVLSICVSLIRRFFKNRNKLRLLENGVIYKDRSVQLDQESMEIIKLLLNSENINSNEILQIVEKPQYSRAHNERIKFQKIEDINFKLKTIFGIDEDLITSAKSDYDRRIRVYSLNKDYLPK